MKLDTTLLKLCKQRGWSLAKLARQSGVPAQTLHGWTTGRTAINMEHLQKVARTLEVPIHQLAFGEPDPFESNTEEILKEIFTGDVRVTLHRIEKRRRS